MPIWIKPRYYIQIQMYSNSSINHQWEICCWVGCIVSVERCCLWVLLRTGLHRFIGHTGPLTGLWSLGGKTSLYSGGYKWHQPTGDHSRNLAVGVVDGPSYPLDALIGGDGAQGGAGVEVVEAEAQSPAAAQLIHKHGLALLINIWGNHGSHWLMRWQHEPVIVIVVIGSLMSILMYIT